MVRRRRAALAVVLTVLAGVAVVAGPALADAGDLSPLPEPTGCVSEDGTGGACADGFALSGPRSVLAVGDNVYVASSDFDDAVAIFDRDPATGALTQKPPNASGEIEGCIGSGDPCRSPGGLVDNPLDLAVSPDGTSLFVVSVSASTLIVLSRDPATGTLRPRPPGQGCFTPIDSSGCTTLVGMRRPGGVAVSPDGRSVYVTGGLSGAVAVLDRDPATGTLTPKPLPSGCIADNPGFEGCADGRGLSGASRLVISPDGKNVYVTGTNDSIPDTVAVLTRDPATGVLSQSATTADCFSVDVSDGLCTQARRTDGAFDVAVSPDGHDVYVAAGFPPTGPSGLAVFTRDGSTGALTQDPGTSGCLAVGGADGCGAAPVLADPQGVAVSPDGRTVAVAALNSGVVSLDRDPTTGVLTARSDQTGCVSDTGSGGGQAGACGDGAALDGTNAVAFSPDGTSVYATGTFANSVVTVDRDDALAPDTAITSAPPAQSAVTTATFAFTATEAGSRFSCRLRPAPLAACSSPTTLTALSPGTYTFDVRAADRFGNADQTFASSTFTVLAPPPVTPQPPPAPDTVIAADVTTQRSQRPRATKIAVVRVDADESVRARAKSTVTLGKRTVVLKKARGEGSGTLRLKLRAKRPADTAAVLAAVDSGVRVKVRVTLVLRDDAGNTETRKLTVTLRP